MELDQVVVKMHQIGCTLNQIMYVANCTRFDVIRILVASDDVTLTPSQLPLSYYIARLKAGSTVKEIAVEMNCNLSGLYRHLNDNGITKYTYNTVEEEQQ